MYRGLDNQYPGFTNKIVHIIGLMHIHVYTIVRMVTAVNYIPLQHAECMYILQAGPKFPEGVLEEVVDSHLSSLLAEPA